MQLLSKSSAMMSVLTNPELFQYTDRPKKTLYNNKSKLDSLQSAEKEFLAQKQSNLNKSEIMHNQSRE